MANAPYPTLPSGAQPDSTQFIERLEDPTMRSTMEGGYVVTRNRHSRTPRKTWPIAYQQLTNADKAAMVAFWNTVTGALMIDWTNPQDGVLYVVRMKTPPEFTYVGVGQTQKWNCAFSLEQV